MKQIFTKEDQGWRHYVPILKSKQGEFKALKETFPETKDTMTPLLEIMDEPNRIKPTKQVHTFQSHLLGIAANVSECWGTDRKIMIDTHYIQAEKVISGVHPLNFLFDEFRVYNVTAVPVTGIRRPISYKAAVKQINTIDKKGLCLRLDMLANNHYDIKRLVDSELNFYGIAPADVDLLIDYKSVLNITAPELQVMITSLINSEIPYISDWRTFTIAASSFPIDLSQLRPDTNSTITRIEWITWVSILNSSLRRWPSYGDYSISHPNMLNLDPKNTNASASIRYTCNNKWLVVKGHSLKKPPCYGQFPYLCEQLIHSTEYSGALYSYGDDVISQYATHKKGTGNLSTWRGVGNNHHFQQTIVQLANLP